MTTQPDPTLTDQAPNASGAACIPVPQLFVVLRCDDLSARPGRHALSHVDEVVLGRGQRRSAERCVEAGVRRLRLTFDDRRMSRRHARLARGPQGWHLHDLGSSNGTRVDGASCGDAPLRDGAWLELGHTFLRFRAGLPTPPDAAGDAHDAFRLDHPAALHTMLPELARAFEQLSRVARSNVSVLLQGETGTGKELLARAVHTLSVRAGACVAINCGALPQSLLEAQLFGHVRGAFSGATRDEPGYVRAADGGSLFLDEVGDLPLASQAALLRVLQEGEVTPVGAIRPIAVDLRVLAATHAPLLELAERGAFREDLYARLCGFTFRALPLRERLEDLGLIIANLLPELRRAAGRELSLQPEAARLLVSHAWPRNVRELQKALGTAAVLTESGSIEAGHLPQAILRRTAAVPEPRRASASGDASLRAELLARFAEHRGNVTQVARAMGKARVQVQRWMKRFDIDPDEFR